jgi:hypothetical protein
MSYHVSELFFPGFPVGAAKALSVIDFSDYVRIARHEINPTLSAFVNFFIQKYGTKLL